MAAGSKAATVNTELYPTGIDIATGSFHYHGELTPGLIDVRRNRRCGIVGSGKSWVRVSSRRTAALYEDFFQSLRVHAGLVTQINPRPASF